MRDSRAARSDWVRLRTVLTLRWCAIAGQLAALLTATFALGIELPLEQCLAVLFVSVAVNVVGGIVLPENKRLSAEYTTAILLFDLFQLAVMLYLTGGLTNPFVVLISGPVIIAATALPFRVVMGLGGMTIAFTSALMFWYVPLTLDGGGPLQLPDIYLFGMWLAVSIAVLFFGIYAARVTNEMFAMSEALVATQMALAREQQLSALGGVVAAAAHELGTPLATIKLAAAELADELEAGSPLAEDAELIGAQAERCREILRDMGRAGKDDTHLHHAPLATVIDEAAQPHADRGKRVIVRLDGNPDPDRMREQPTMSRTPEIIHGLRNLVQNAVDFADSTVWVDATWDHDVLRIVVGDDGPGYPPELIGRLGDPFTAGRRRRRDDGRKGYESMGLGLFIAKTLLERSGAQLTFTNGSQPGRRRPKVGAPQFARPPGALVEVAWPRRAVAPLEDAARGALDRNRPILQARPTG